MVLIDLYFGRDIAGRPALTDAEWAAFTRTQITPRFPDGFTVIEARGQWLDPGTKAIDEETSKMVRIAAKPAASLADRIMQVTNAYRQQFRQSAVGIASQPTCGAF